MRFVSAEQGCKLFVIFLKTVKKNFDFFFYINYLNINTNNFNIGSNRQIKINNLFKLRIRVQEIMKISNKMHQFTNHILEFVFISC